jgi:hypothetical protein
MESSQKNKKQSNKSVQNSLMKDMNLRFGHTLTLGNFYI